MKQRLRKKVLSLYFDFVLSSVNANYLYKAVARVGALNMLCSGFTVRCITSNVYKHKKERKWQRK